MAYKLKSRLHAFL